MKNKIILEIIILYDSSYNKQQYNINSNKSLNVGAREKNDNDHLIQWLLYFMI